MQRFTPQIAYYLEMVRQGDMDGAFHGLLEMDFDVLPELIAEFRAQQDIDVRELLLKVVWEYRQSSIIPFLGEALLDVEPRIWRQAMNGLVALASTASIDALRSARKRRLPALRDTEEFHRCLEEAIEQTEVETQKA